MRVLITGITGMAGSHLADYLLEKGGIEVHGIKRWRSRIENIEHIMNRITLHECELTDATSVKKMLKKVMPERIYHLAAQSFVPTSWNSPADTLMNNIVGQLNILEAIRDLGIKDTRMHIAGSSEEYGLVYENEAPVKETNPLRPLSPYAVSKIGQDFLAYQYYMSYGIFTLRTRAFNHTGPRRGDVFVTSNFAKQIASIEKGLQKPVISVGNIEARRDFTDTRDIVKAYYLSLEKGDAGEVYNIGSDRAYGINEVLNVLLSFSKIDVTVKEDPERMRPSDVPLLLCDSTKFREKTGWKPEIRFEKTMEDLLNYWRERV